MRSILGSIFILWLCFMFFFVPGNEPFGFTPNQWGMAWLTPLTLAFCLVGLLVLRKRS